MERRTYKMLFLQWPGKEEFCYGDNRGHQRGSVTASVRVSKPGKECPSVGQEGLMKCWHAIRFSHLDHEYNDIFDFINFE